MIRRAVSWALMVKLCSFKTYILERLDHLKDTNIYKYKNLSTTIRWRLQPLPRSLLELDLIFPPFKRYKLNRGNFHGE